MEWIDLKDTATPPFGVDVLLSYNDGVFNGVTKGRLSQNYNPINKKPMLFWSYEKGTMRGDVINGWMHLPKPKN